ncbi:MAG TPA: hypothetical protein VGG39_09295 [Polyangiaceae bacterium]|jgi:hypothetical protein
MVDAANPPDATPPLGTAEELGPVWDRFRKGGAVDCPNDAGPMALSVDAAAGVYRLVCTNCGFASPWFESGPGGIRMRGQSQPAVSTRNVTPGTPGTPEE